MQKTAVFTTEILHNLPKFKFTLSFSFPEEASLASKVGLPADDFTLLQQKGVYFQPVPIFLYLTAYALVELFSFIAQIPFTVLGSIVFRLCGG